MKIKTWWPRRITRQLALALRIILQHSVNSSKKMKAITSSTRARAKPILVTRLRAQEVIAIRYTFRSTPSIRQHYISSLLSS